MLLKSALKTVSCIVAAGVASKGTITDRRVPGAGCVTLKRIKTDCRVEEAGVVQERIFTQDGVFVR